MVSSQINFHLLILPHLIHLTLIFLLAQNDFNILILVPYAIMMIYYLYSIPTSLITILDNSINHPLLVASHLIPPSLSFRHHLITYASICMLCLLCPDSLRCLLQFVILLLSFLMYCWVISGTPSLLLSESIVVLHSLLIKI